MDNAQRRSEKKPLKKNFCLSSRFIFYIDVVRLLLCKLNDFTEKKKKRPQWSSKMKNETAWRCTTQSKCWFGLNTFLRTLFQMTCQALASFSSNLLLLILKWNSNVLSTVLHHWNVSRVIWSCLMVCQKVWKSWWVVTGTETVIIYWQTPTCVFYTHIYINNNNNDDDKLLVNLNMVSFLLGLFALQCPACSSLPWMYSF